MRLIDADALKNEMLSHSPIIVGDFYKMLDLIDNSQTVIIPVAELDTTEDFGEWISCSDMLPKENICDDGYVEPSDYVLVFGDHGNYGVSRYWGNRRTKKTNPHSFSDWMDLEWFSQKPIAWMPLPKPYKEEGEQNESCN